MSDDENAELLDDWESDCYVLRDEIARLSAENEKLRKAIKDTNVMLKMACEALEKPTHSPLDVGFRHSPLSQKEIIQRLTETCSFVRADLLKTIDEARAALGGVTKLQQSGAGNE